VLFSAHRENLIGKNIYNKPDFRHFAEIIGSLSILHKLFGPTSVRREKLKQRLTRAGRREVVLQSIHKIRWIGSLRKAMRKALNIYPYIIEELREALQDGNLNDDQTLEVQKVIKLMTSPTYLTGTAFLLDVFGMMDTFSLASQLKNALAIDHAPLRSNILKSTRALRVNIHKTLEELLQDAVCRTNEGVQQQCSLGLFEEGKTSYRGIQLNSGAVYPYSTALVLLRPNLVDGLVQKIAYYFPEQESADLYYVDPKSFFIPEDVDVRYQSLVQGVGLNLYVYEFGEIQIKRLSGKLGWNSDETSNGLYEDWKELIHSIVVQPNFKDARKKSPSEFWLYTLSNKDLNWTPNVRRFVLALLVIPANNAEIER
jgi:hypothetical protein